MPFVVLCPVLLRSSSATCLAIGWFQCLYRMSQVEVKERLVEVPQVLLHESGHLALQCWYMLSIEAVILKGVTRSFIFLVHELSVSCLRGF